jgi:hypothetical protein
MTGDPSRHADPLTNTNTVPSLIVLVPLYPDLRSEFREFPPRSQAGPSWLAPLGDLNYCGVAQASWVYIGSALLV